MPDFNLTSYSINFGWGVASVDGVRKSTDISLPEFTNVGIYTYKIEEVKGNTKGVEYESVPVILTVTVTNCPENDGQLDRHYTMAYEGEDGNKITSVENTYSAGKLSVEKEVRGILGDTKKDFNFTLTFTDSDSKEIRSNISYAIVDSETGDKISEGSIKYSDWQNSQAVLNITLKDGQKINLSNIPYELTYTVVEAEANQDGYETTYNYSDTEKKIDSAADEVEVINEKGGDIPTGIFWNSAPYVAGAAVIVLLGIALVVRRRKVNQ